MPEDLRRTTTSGFADSLEGSCGALGKLAAPRFPLLRLHARTADAAWAWEWTMLTRYYEGQIITAWAHLADGGRWTGCYSIDSEAKDVHTHESYPTDTEAEEAALEDAKKLIDGTL